MRSIHRLRPTALATLFVPCLLMAVAVMVGLVLTSVTPAQAATPPNDDQSSPMTLTLGVAATIDVSGATTSPTEAAYYQHSRGTDAVVPDQAVWFSFTATTTNTRITPSSGEVMWPNPQGTYALYPTYYPTVITFPTTPGQSYAIAVFTNDASSLTVQADEIPPPVNEFHLDGIDGPSPGTLTASYTYRCTGGDSQRGVPYLYLSTVGGSSRLAQSDRVVRTCDGVQRTGTVAITAGVALPSQVQVTIGVVSCVPLTGAYEEVCTNPSPQTVTVTISGAGSGGGSTPPPSPSGTLAITGATTVDHGRTVDVTLSYSCLNATQMGSVVDVSSSAGNQLGEADSATLPGIVCDGASRAATVNVPMTKKKAHGAIVVTAQASWTGPGGTADAAAVPFDVQLQ